MTQAAGVVLAIGLASAPIAAGTGEKGDKQHAHQTFKDRDLTRERLGELIEEYRATLGAELKSLAATAMRRMDREYEEYQQTGQLPVRDILIISGGGAKGAFGAGFLEAWGEVRKGPLTRPEFDVVTGVSTGALIAPYAFIGSSQSYADIAKFYATPEANLIKKRGTLFFLPGNVSLYDNRNLQDFIHEQIDGAVLRGIAKGSAEDRLLLIGATNLDLGIGQVFDVGREARRAIEIGSPNRVHSILLASSAIPGMFPPIELDGLYYADGGISSQVFTLTMLHHGDNPVARWRAEHPGATAPKLRFWVIVNEALTLDLDVTQPRWTAITARSLRMLMRSGMLSALRDIEELASNTRELGLEAEFRFVAIPEDAPNLTGGAMFDLDYMNQLAEIGRRMGRDSSSWQTQCPDTHWLSQW